MNDRDLYENILFRFWFECEREYEKNIVGSLI